MAEVKKVWIDQDECISCEACVGEAPDVLEMVDDKAQPKAEAKSPDFCKQHSDQIIAAAEACPSDAVKYETA